MTEIINISMFMIKFFQELGYEKVTYFVFNTFINVIKCYGFFKVCKD